VEDLATLSVESLPPFSGQQHIKPTAILSAFVFVVVLERLHSETVMIVLDIFFLSFSHFSWLTHFRLLLHPTSGLTYRGPVLNRYPLRRHAIAS
jgi:hypothetical protein